MLNNLHTFWAGIELVLLDMDGTLLDRHFDDYFWTSLVPETYAAKHNLELDRARTELSARFKSREGTLEWADLDFWSEELGLDIPALKVQIEHLIEIHPYVLDFIDYCRENDKRVCLVTNAHGKTLDIKMAKTALRNRFDKIICSQQIGVAKEEPVFWERLKDHLDYDPARTMLADDTEAVLVSADQAGIAQLVYVARPSSKLAPQKSARFHSISYFKELIIS
ncbi:MAG: HAD family hydrolase [Desulfurivibrionaceae bacterium]